MITICPECGREIEYFSGSAPRICDECKMDIAYESFLSYYEIWKYAKSQEKKDEVCCDARHIYYDVGPDIKMDWISKKAFNAKSGDRTWDHANRRTNLSKKGFRLKELGQIKNRQDFRVFYHDFNFQVRVTQLQHNTELNALRDCFSITPKIYLEALGDELVYKVTGKKVPRRILEARFNQYKKHFNLEV